jgi:hypothetical protein
MTANIGSAARGRGPAHRRFVLGSCGAMMPGYPGVARQSSRDEPGKRMLTAMIASTAKIFRARSIHDLAVRRNTRLSA